MDCKEIQPINPKGNQSWIFIGRTDVEAETPILWPPEAKSWCWERLKAGGEGDDRGWDGWMASPAWWTWVWVNSGSWQRSLSCCSLWGHKVGHNWVTELHWNSPKLDLWPKVWSILENVPCALENKVYSSAFG